MWDLLSLGDLGYDTGSSENYRSHYLDGDVALTNGARVAYDYGHPPSFTNVTFAIGWTNAPVSHVSHIEMTLTNGTTSVYTNKWTASIYLPVTNAVTNVVSACPLDFCHASDGPFPGFPNAQDLDVSYQMALLHGSVSAQMYDALHAAVRLADTSSPTNEEEYVLNRRIKTFYPDGSVNYVFISTTGITQIAEYGLSADNTPWKYAWNEETQSYDTYYTVTLLDEITPSYLSISPTRFQSDIVTTGSAVRVEIDSAFAVVDFRYIKGHLEGPAPRPNHVTDVDINKTIVVRVDTFSVDVSQKDALARVTLDSRSLCVAAASAAGVPLPPGNSEEYEPPPDEDYYWNAKCSSLVLIYRIHPSSKFADWQ